MFDIQVTGQEWVYIIVIYACCGLAIAFALLQSVVIRKINIKEPRNFIKEGNKDEIKEPLMDGQEEPVTKDHIDNLAIFGEKISSGAQAFLWAEYKILAIFIVIFAILVYIVVDFLGAKPSAGTKYLPYATIAFVIGAVTSIICGYIGMRIAVDANYRTTFKAMHETEKEQAEAFSGAFDTAYRAGCVMGFGLVGISLGILNTIMIVYIYCYAPTTDGGARSYEILMDLVAGYGLGGSSMALFGRVGGGIYTKAADVGSDLAGKVDGNLPEDDPRNPGVVADNVGDNVGDIAGMGSDLFGSFAESTCASLV